MTAAQRQATEWIKRGVQERVDELTDAWLASEDKDERERLHATARATIELEDYLSARIKDYADG